MRVEQHLLEVEGKKRLEPPIRSTLGQVDGLVRTPGQAEPMMEKKCEKKRIHAQCQRSLRNDANMLNAETTKQCSAWV